MIYKYARPFFFRIDPEISHIAATSFLRALPYFRPLTHYYTKDYPQLKQNIWGNIFSNPVGLAAGFDKNAQMITPLSCLGFGFLEVGTVTVRPQKGNPKPRLFRLKKYRSLQNAMGFNNDGSEVMQKRLKKTKATVPIGVNLGKNKDTPQEKSLDDYCLLIDAFKELCDYFVINISSPNTPGLRKLQNQGFVEKVFLAAREKTSKPILLKVSPDESSDHLIGITEAAIASGASGVIISNTSIDYSLCPEARSFGGLSGQVLREKSFDLLKKLAEKFYGKTTLISVGGIDSGPEAYRRIKEGASLVQLYTSFIYEGPSLIKHINEELLRLLEKDRLESINDAVGMYRK